MNTSQPTDQLSLLLSHCACGDHQAFAHLYQVTAPKLFALAISILKREDLAADALQEGFIEIWQHAGDYQPDKGAAMTWMTSIVRYRALDILRRTRREVSRDETVEQSLESERRVSTPDPLRQAWEGHTVLSYLEDLTVQQRQSILLAYFYGYTHAELAQNLYVPLGTVKSWIRRGLKYMRKHASHTGERSGAPTDTLLCRGSSDRERTNDFLAARCYPSLSRRNIYG